MALLESIVAASGSLQAPPRRHPTLHFKAHLLIVCTTMRSANPEVPILQELAREKRSLLHSMPCNHPVYTCRHPESITALANVRTASRATRFRSTSSTDTQPSTFLSPYQIA